MTEFSSPTRRPAPARARRVPSSPTAPTGSHADARPGNPRRRPTRHQQHQRYHRRQPTVPAIPAAARCRRWIVSSRTPASTAQVILAEVGLDMSKFRTADHLASPARLSPRTIQSDPQKPHREDRQGQPLPQVRAGHCRSRGRPDRRLPRREIPTHGQRRGKAKSLAAVRSILVITWHLLADPAARYHDLGADYHANKNDKSKQSRSHVRQLQALGFIVTLREAACQVPPSNPADDRDKLSADRSTCTVLVSRLLVLLIIASMSRSCVSLTFGVDL
jgi:hypothetical protein